MEMDFEKICRTCLSSDCPLVSIFENNVTDLSESESSSVIDLLTTLTDIKIFYDDQLPKQICSSCVQELKRSHSFKLKCQNSQETLQIYLNGNDSITSPDVCIKGELSNDYTMFNSNYHESAFIESCTSSDHQNDQKEISQTSIYRNETRVEKPKAIQEPVELKTYKCPKCLEIFDEAKILQTHILVSHTENLLCQVCNKELKNHLQLRKHCMRHVPLDYFCTQCDRKFKQLDYLSLHIRRHSETGKKYKCSYCDRLFLNSTELNIHMPTHSTDCPFVCDICGLKYKRKDARDTHRTKHTGERSIKCDICFKICLSSYKLSIHKRSHTGEKPFECNLCDKKFTQRSSLTVHKRIHTNERPFVCPYCSATFRQCSTIAEHLQRVHKDKPPVPRNKLVASASNDN